MAFCDFYNWPYDFCNFYLGRMKQTNGVKLGLIALKNSNIKLAKASQARCVRDTICEMW